MVIVVVVVVVVVVAVVTVATSYHRKAPRHQLHFL